MSAAAAYHSVQAFLPENPVRSWFTALRSMLYFRPDRKSYGALAPPSADESEPFARVAQAVADTELDLVAWLVITHNSLATTHPQFAVRPLGGDPLPGALCPAQAAVQEYAVALAGEVDARFAPTALDLEMLGWVAAPHHAHAKVGVPLGDAARYAAGLCVCDACTAIGGRDVAARLLSVARGRRAESLDLDQLLLEDGEIRAFQQARERVVRELVESIARAVRSRIHVLHWGDPRPVGIDLGVLDAADRVTVAAYTADADAVERILNPALAACGAHRVVAGLSLCHPEAPDAATFRACLERTRALGVENISIYNHSLVTGERLRWV